MPIMPIEPGPRELLLRRREDLFPEPLRAQLAHQREPRGCEEHLLPHGSGVGDVGYGDEGGALAGGVAAQDDVQRGIGLEMGLEEGEIVFEGGGCGFEDG